MGSSVQQHTGVDPHVYLMVEQMRNGAWKTTEVPAKNPGAHGCDWYSFYLITVFQNGSDFTAFNSPSQERSSPCGDIQPLGLEAFLSSSPLLAQYDPVQSTHHSFSAALRPQCELLDYAWW